MTAGMSRSEQEDLLRIVRGRERQAKAEAKQREAVLRAEVEQELTAEYEAQDAMWEEAVTIAEQAIAKANAEIKAACLDLGVPPKHAPQIASHWMSRSLSYSDRQRRAEVRKLAIERLRGLTQTAIAAIEAKSLEIQTAIIAGGLASAQAREIFTSLPSAEQLMPPLAIEDLGVTHWQPPEDAAHRLMAPLTTADRKRRRVLRAIEANPGATDREIGRIAGVDHKTVSAYRRDRHRGELAAGSGEFPTGPPDHPSDDRPPHQG